MSQWLCLSYLVGWGLMIEGESHLCNVCMIIYCYDLGLGFYVGSYGCRHSKQWYTVTKLFMYLMYLT